MGSTAEVAVTKSSRWSVRGEICSVSHFTPLIQPAAATGARRGRATKAGAAVSRGKDDDLDSARLASHSSGSSIGSVTQPAHSQVEPASECNGGQCTSDACCQSQPTPQQQQQQQLSPERSPDTNVHQENARFTPAAPYRESAAGGIEPSQKTDRVAASAPAQSVAAADAMWPVASSAARAFSSIDCVLLVGAGLGLTGVLLSGLLMLRESI